MEKLTNSPDSCEQTRKSIRGKIKNTQRAYLAGFIDGEGSIGLYSTNSPKQRQSGWTPSFYSRICVGNTDAEIPKFLKEIYGGWLGLENREFNGQKVLPIHRYNATGKICDCILRDIVPYLKQKKDRALMVIKYYQNRKKLTWDEKESLRLKLVGLNGNSRKNYHPQRLNERTPYIKGQKSFQQNDLIKGEAIV
jgi:hypothetical protein